MERWTSHFMELMGETKTRTIWRRRKGEKKKKKNQREMQKGGKKEKINF